MTVSCVSFDLDDTLYPYRRYAQSGLAAAADLLEERTGTEYAGELQALYFEEGRTGDTFDVLVERHDLEGQLVDELVEAFHAAGTSLSPYDETESVLRRLGERYDLGLITDGRGGHAKLERLGLGSYFDAVVVTPTIDTSKHDETPFRRVLDDCEVVPDEAVYVGDDPRVDFRVPNRLGMTTIRCRRGRYTQLEAPEAEAAPEYEIESLKNVLSVLEADGQTA